MEENKEPMKRLDDLDAEIKEIERQREMTEERAKKRKKILMGAGIAISVGGAAVFGYVMWLIYNAPAPMMLGGAMGQWEEIPMTPEDCAVKIQSLRGNEDYS